MIVTDAQLEWVRRPLQARSQQTLERLLDAAEAIIEEQGLEALTVVDVAKRAGSSVGAFYSRFADKEGLLRCLFERFTDQAVATTEAALTPARWDGVPVEDVLETTIRFMVGVLRAKRGLIVALLVRTATDPGLAALGQRFHEQITEFVAALVKHRSLEIDHPQPEEAIGLAVWMVVSALQVRMIYAAAGAERYDDATVAAEVTRMATRYLGLAQDRTQDVPASSRRLQARSERKPRRPAGESGR